MKKIALLTGWSKEKEISFRSAKNIENNLKKTHKVDIFVLPEDIGKFFATHKNYDLVVPMGHGEYIEDGKIIGLLEILNKKYLLSSAETHAICMNKYLTNLMVKDLGFTVPESVLVQKIDDIKNIKFKNKFFVKPNHGGSSVDTSVFENVAKAKKTITHILTYDDAIVQQAIKGREFTVSVIGDYDKKPQAIAVTEVVTKREFFDHAAKYEWKDTQEITPANIDKKMQKELENTALTIYTILKIRTLSRIDFLYSKGKFYFLEVNTIPGMTEKSFLPQALEYHGTTTEKFFNDAIKNL